MGSFKSQTNTPQDEKATERLASSWAELGFTCESTADQSPTLRLLSSAEWPESMHHSGGAWTESDLIYGSVLREAFDQLEKPRILSVGLGLGYNEILVAREARRTGKSFHLVSFEIVQGLTDSFKSFVFQKKLSSELLSTYQQILSFIEESERKNLLLELAQSAREERWLCPGEFIPATFPEPVNLILYDAFSSKTNPTLWEEDFLTSMIQTISESDALFATYACTGALKRALKKNSFLVEVREGFQGKRNSTRARRGLFNSEVR